MKTLFLLFALSISVLSVSGTSAKLTRILDSGNGQSPETAYQVYNIAEEYQLLQHLNLTPSMQMLSIVDGDYYDIFLIEDQVVYFKIVTKPEATQLLQPAAA